MAFDLTGKALKELRLPTTDYGNTSIRVIPAQVGDSNSRFLKVSLFDDRGTISLANYTRVTLNATLPDGTPQNTLGEIDPSGKFAICKIAGSMLSQAGKVACDVRFIMINGEDEPTSLSSPTFYILNSESQTSDDVAEGSDGYDLLLQIENELSALKNIAEIFLTDDDILQIEGDRDDKVISQKVVTDKLNNINELVGLPVVIASGTVELPETAYTNATITEGVSLKKGETLTIKISRTSEALGKILTLRMKTEGGTSLVQINTNETEAEFITTYTPFGNYDNVIVYVYSGATKGSVSVSMETIRETGMSPLNGKVIVNFGDSIFGMLREPYDISTKLAKLTRATVHNCAFGGCRMGKHVYSNYDAFGMYNIADAITSGDFTLQDQAIADTSATLPLQSNFPDALAVLKSIDFSKVDIITIAYGTNDFGGGLTLDNENNSQDTNTMAGALRYSIEKILTAFPQLKIFICSPTYRFWMDGNNEFVDDSDTHISNGKKLTDFVESQRDISTMYHLPFIDNYYDLGINKFNRTQYFSGADSTHQNQVGRDLIAENMASKLSMNGVSYGASKNNMDSFLTEENEEWEV